VQASKYQAMLVIDFSELYAPYFQGVTEAIFEVSDLLRGFIRLNASTPRSSATESRLTSHSLPFAGSPCVYPRPKDSVDHINS
jgi:hypothetical protein